MLGLVPDEPTTVAVRSFVSDFRGTLPGSPAIGDHGPEFKPEPLPPANVEAILDCGHRVSFPVAPISGEWLYCLRCQTWETCVVPGGYLVKCETCAMGPESHFGHDSVLALARARTHAYGKGKRKRNTPHLVLIGRFTEGSVDWRPFERE